MLSARRLLQRFGFWSASEVFEEGLNALLNWEI
jgi:hypothetical protein